MKKKKNIDFKVAMDEKKLWSNHATFPRRKESNLQEKKKKQKGLVKILIWNVEWNNDKN